MGAGVRLGACIDVGLVALSLEGEGKSSHLLTRHLPAFLASRSTEGCVVCLFSSCKKWNSSLPFMKAARVDSEDVELTPRA